MDESLKEFDRSDTPLQPIIIIKEASVIKHIKNNCYPNLMMNKGGYKNLLITSHFLDEMHQSIPIRRQKFYPVKAM